MNKALLSNNNHPNISLTCQKFQYGGGMERYIIDIVNGLSQANITPKIYSAKFDTTLPEYTLINPVKINLSFVPKKWRTSFLSYFSNKYKETSEISLTTSYTLSDVVICGGNHKGYLQASKKNPSISDRFKIMGEQKSLNQSKYVIAHSALMKKELVELYHVSENKIDVIYPPINTDKFTQINEEERVKLREKLGFKKDLTREEIISQILFANSYIKKRFGKKEDGSNRSVRNVVFMGMGEPLLNYENMRKSLEIMLQQDRLSL